MDNSNNQRQSSGNIAAVNQSLGVQIAATEVQFNSQSSFLVVPDGRQFQIVEENVITIASESQKRELYSLSKTPEGFSAVQRRDCWMLASGALQAMLSSPPSYYENLVNYCETFQVKYPSSHLHQIRLDLPRTFADEIYFNQKSSIGQEIVQQIERVCLAYAVRNSVIGYCQGFNFIVGRLLQVLTEEETFYMLCQIIECIMPLDYYQLMVGARIDQKIMEQLLQQSFPNLLHHFEKCGYEPQISTLQWFTCMFSYTFSFQPLQRLWDLIFIKGSVVIFGIGLAIFHELEPLLMKCTTLQSIVKVMETSKEILTDAVKFIQIVDKYMLTQRQIDEMRVKFRVEIVQEMEMFRHTVKEGQFDKSGFMSRFPLYKGMQQLKPKRLDQKPSYLLDQIICSEQWPTCFLDCSQTVTLHEFFVFFSMAEIKHSYFYPEENKIDDYQSLQQNKNILTEQVTEQGNIANKFSQPVLIIQEEQSSGQAHNPNDQVMISRFPHYCTGERLQYLVKMLVHNELNCQAAKPDKIAMRALILLQQAQNVFNIDIHRRRHPQIQTSTQFEPTFETVEIVIEKYFARQLD